MTKTCPKCQTHQAIKDPTYGYIECLKCQEDTDKPVVEPEFTTDEVRADRRRYAKDIIQPWRDGKLSKEYIDAHGTKGIKATKKEIKNADYVWKDVKGHWSKHR